MNEQEKLERNREYQRDWMRKFRARNLDKIRKRNAEWMQRDRVKNPLKYSKRGKKWRKSHPLKCLEWRNKWLSVPGNIERRRAKMKERYYSNKPRLLAQSKEYSRKRRAQDPLFRAICSARCRTKLFIRKAGFKKTSSISMAIGCSPLELKSHLESLFLPNMSWENYGRYGWHIDHKIPLCSADSMDGVIKLCHYTNLQPLWAKDNLLKSGNIITDSIDYEKVM